MTGRRIDVQLPQDGFDVVLLSFGILMRYVSDVKNDVRLDHFFQRRPKRRDQHGRKVGDEADGVGKHRLAAVRKCQCAQRGIECREQHVHGLYIGTGQTVEQRRLARIGVADQGDYAIRHPLAARAVQAACRLYFSDLVLDANDTFADHAAVGLDLGFARSPEKAKTAALAFEMSP